MDETICFCLKITLDEIIEAIKEGSETVEALVENTCAGEACEQCQSEEMDPDEEMEVYLDEIIAYVQSR